MTTATSAGTTGDLVTTPRSANPLVRSYETPRPVASGDERCRPHPQSPAVFNSGHRFLIDTGAEVNIIPPLPLEQKNRQDCSGLKAVNGSSIATYGNRSLTLDLGLRRVFRWIFVIADIQTPIIGADFLRQYGLLVNMKHGQLVDMTTNLQSQGTIYHVESLRPSFHLQTDSTEYDALMAEFPSVTRPCLPPQPVKHSVTHHINTTGPPVHASARRLPPDRLRITRQEFEHMLGQDIIQPSNSQWFSPLQLNDISEQTQICWNSPKL